MRARTERHTPVGFVFELNSLILKKGRRGASDGEIVCLRHFEQKEKPKYPARFLFGRHPPRHHPSPPTPRCAPLLSSRHCPWEEPGRRRRPRRPAPFPPTTTTLAPACSAVGFGRRAGGRGRNVVWSNLVCPSVVDLKCGHSFL